MKSKSSITRGLLLIMVICGYVGYATIQGEGFGWRQSTNLPMTTHKLEAERNKYWWSGSLNHYFSTKNPKIIVYRDSQAFDIFSSLKNSPHIGLVYFPHSFKCSAFFISSISFDGTPELCRSFYDALIKSKEIKEADYLIYSRDWDRMTENPTNYPIALNEIKKINPQIKIIFLGQNPALRAEPLILFSEIAPHLM